MPIIDNELVNDVPMDSFESPDGNVGEYFLERVKQNIIQLGDRTWMHDVSTGKSMTYSEMVTGVTSMASALRKRGLQVGDAVLLMAPNFIEVALTFLGTWKAGGACACLTLSLFPEDIRARAHDLKAKFILTDEACAKRVLEAVKDLECIQEVFVIGQAEGCTSVYELLQDDGKDCPERLEIDVDSLAWLMYSSGTTGIPKGIVHTHRTMTALLHNGSKNPNPGLKLLFINYMINSGGNILFLLFTAVHTRIFVMSDFHDEKLLKAIEEVKAYGMSETSLIASNLRDVKTILASGKQQAIKNHVVGTVGKVVPFVRVKIVDELTGEKLGPNQIGEICVKSPYLLKEYRNNPKATMETVREGWIHTGDKGYYNNDENIFIVGRFKELIKYRMAHVVPTNIEKQMMTHPAIEEVGVVGLPHEVDGELPLAFVVLRKGQSATAQELIDYTNELVVDEEKLRGGVRFIEKIPRNELGKIVRPALSKLL